MAIPISKNNGMSVADWMLKAIAPNSGNEEAKNAMTVSSEKDMIDAKTKIDKAAAAGKKVFVAKEMSEQHKGEIKEYAQACGMKDSDVVQVSESEKKAASLKEEPAKPKGPAPDPFGSLKSFAPETAFAKRPMQAEGAKKTDEKGRSSGVVGRVDGDEKYETQMVVGVRSGENSIAAPNNIGKTIESKEKSSVDVIREQNQARKDKTTFNKKEWEKDIASTLPQGVKAVAEIKMTGAGTDAGRPMVAPGQHSMFDAKDNNLSVPDKTAGETLKDIAQKRKEDIQRPKSEDKSWNTVESSVKSTVSDVFYEELKKRMQK